MARFALVALATVLAGALPSCKAAYDEACKLTQGEPAKPTPSLVQCYKFNTEACCVSGHDNVILNEYSATLSDSCLREYPQLEHFFCLGCDPEQNKFTYSNDGATPVIKVCESFARDLYELDLERCGINIKIANPLEATNPVASWVRGIHEPSTERQVILPSLVFDNATSFLNAIKPPFFENYEVEIVPSTESETLCFSSGARRLSTLLAPLLAISVILRLV